MDEQQKNRLREIVKLAIELGWVYPPNKTSYPLMQLSEVEKCMLAMASDFELERMRKWVKESKDPEYQRKLEEAGKLRLVHRKDITSIGVMEVMIIQIK